MAQTLREWLRMIFAKLSGVELKTTVTPGDDGNNYIVGGVPQAVTSADLEWIDLSGYAL